MGTEVEGKGDYWSPGALEKSYWELTLTCDPKCHILGLREGWCSKPLLEGWAHKMMLRQQYYGVLFLVAQSCLTLWDPMDCQAPLSMSIPQARILEWVATPSSRGLSQPRGWTQVSCIAVRFFIIWATRKSAKFLTLILHPWKWVIRQQP